jgi:hypothetical protein
MIVFSRRPFLESWEQISDLADAHVLETLGFIAHPNVEHYGKMEDAGMLRLYLVHEDGVCIGYCTMAVTLDIHDVTRTIAVQDGVYIRPDRRNGTGRRFIAWIDRKLAEEGVFKVIRAYRLGVEGPDRVYASLGYMPSEISYECQLTPSNPA